MSHHSSGLTVSPPKICSPVCPTNFHVSVSLHQNFAIRYVPPFITSHSLSTKIVLSVMSQNSSRFSAPPTIFSLRYVSPFITNHCLNPSIVLSVMCHHSSRITASPPKLYFPLCPKIHHISLSLHQHCSLVCRNIHHVSPSLHQHSAHRYVPPIITSRCPSTNIVLSVMSHHSSRLTVSPLTLCSPLCLTILHISLSLHQLSALRYVPLFITSHSLSAKTVFSVMSRHSARPATLPPTLCSPLCPTIHHVSLSLHQHCAIRYVPPIITSHFLSTNNLLSVMSRQSSRLTFSPPTICSPLCPTIHHVSLSLH